MNWDFRLKSGIPVEREMKSGIPVEREMSTVRKPATDGERE